MLEARAEEAALTAAARVAIDTGASSGIGRAIAARLAARGTRVFAVGRDAARLDALVAAGGSRIEARRVDLEAQDASADLAREIRATAGRLDILVHSAGAISLAPLATASIAQLDAQWSANLRGPWALTRALLPLLVEARGDVVFVNSSIVRHPRAEAGLFAATQHALRGVADCLRAELNPQGVRVLSVFPGRTATARQRRLHAAEGRRYVPERMLQPDDVAEVVAHAVSLPRTAELTEIHLRPMHRILARAGARPARPRQPA